MGKTAAQRDVHDFDAGRALQQLAARGLEPDLAQHGARRLADKGKELPLQRPAGNAGDGGQLRQTPIAPDIAAHGIQHAPDAAWQRRSC
jgi:hypothetical protein